MEEVKKETKEKKKNANLSNKTFNLYTKPNYKNKIKSNHDKLKKKENGKVVAHMIEKKDRMWNQPIWVPKEVIINMKGPQSIWVPKKTWSFEVAMGIWRLGLQNKVKIQANKPSIQDWRIDEVHDHHIPKIPIQR